MTIMVRGAALAVLCLALAVLAGYALHLPAIVTVIPGLQGMSPVTALGLAVLAVSTLAELARRPTLARTFAWLALGISMAILACQLSIGSDVISPWVSKALFGFPPDQSGKTSVATAICLGVLSFAALMRRLPAAAAGAAAVALVISGLAVLGYAYGVRDLYALIVFRTMAAHTAIGLMILSLASLFTRSESGWAATILAREPGGAATRRQLAFVLLPPVAGGLLLALTDAHRLGPALAMAFLVSITIIPLALLILRDGQLLIAADRERLAHAGLLRSELASQAEVLKAESGERLAAQAAMARAQRLDAVGQLTGGIAHDFNNLLMAIGGNLQLLSKRLPVDHPGRRFADNASAAVEKGSRLTGQLLAFSRIQKLDMRAVELDVVLREARELIGNALGPGIEIEMRLSATGCWVVTDPDQLELAILNLSLNARDAMPAGGALTIESAVVSEEDDGGLRAMACIRVIDIGQGMSSDVIRRAVEPFFTTKARGEGTGLGLAQVYGFVKQCGGELRIESEIDAGSTIVLLLPLAVGDRDAATPTLSTPDTAIVGGAGQSILVIDDDSVVRAMIVDALEDAGFKVIEADGGEVGLGLLDSHTPAAAIVDFIMPGMNGAEVAKRIQARLPTLPIIFISGYFDTLALDGVRHAGILRKPFDIDALEGAVSSALQ